MLRSIPILLALLLTPGLTESAFAGPETDARIEKIKVERQRLARVRAQLEGKMGEIGRELRKLDAALITARKATKAAATQVREADRKLAGLNRERDRLQSRIDGLRKQMLDESTAAWKRGSRTSEWIGIFTGVPVSDIPHRRYLLNVVMRSQEQDRQSYIKAVADLQRVEAELLAQRETLEALRREKKAAENELAARVGAKRGMLDRVRRDVVSKKQRDRQLAREEKALLRLLDDMSEGLLAVEKSASGEKVRKRKGRLKWPVSGRLVASFGSRPSPQMPRLQGVQLRPDANRREVKAMAAGQVRYADWFGGFGLMTIVDYGEGVLGVYAHNDVLYKQLGDWVEEGETIAEAGSTGWINKVAVYFEIRDRGKAVNPKRWCRR